MPAELIVRGNQLTCNGQTYRCAHGKGGFSSDKKEGDGATPIGTFALRECWYRADRLDAPKTKLPLRVIQERDGWCDDPKSRDYNRHVILPPPLRGRVGEGGVAVTDGITISPPPNLPPRGGEEYSHEKLWRDDHAYDIIVPLGYNDDPAVPGKGSAIFLHCMHDDGRATEGCIALAKADFLAILRDIHQDTSIKIEE